MNQEFTETKTTPVDQKQQLRRYVARWNRWELDQVKERGLEPIGEPTKVELLLPYLTGEKSISAGQKAGDVYAFKAQIFTEWAEENRINLPKESAEKAKPFDQEVAA